MNSILNYLIGLKPVVLYKSVLRIGFKSMACFNWKLIINFFSSPLKRTWLLHNLYN